MEDIENTFFDFVEYLQHLFCRLRTALLDFSIQGDLYSVNEWDVDVVNLPLFVPVLTVNVAKNKCTNFVL